MSDLCYVQSRIEHTLGDQKLKRNIIKVSKQLQEVVLELMQKDREQEQQPKTVYRLFEIFDKKYKGIEDEKKRFLDEETLLPFLIISEWVVDVAH